MKTLQGSGPSGTPEYREDGVSLSQGARLSVELVLRVLNALGMPLLFFPYVPHIIPEKRHAKQVHLLRPSKIGATAPQVEGFV